MHVHVCAQVALSTCIFVGTQDAGKARDATRLAWEDGVRESPWDVLTSLQECHK